MPETALQQRTTTAEFRRQFRDYEDRIAIANARRASLLAAIFMLAGWSLDLVVFPHQANAFLIIRIISFVLLGGIFLHLGRLIGSPDQGHFVASGIALTPLIAICAMIVRTGGGESPYYAGLSLVLVGLSLLLRWSFKKSLAMIAICLVFYAISVSLPNSHPDPRILFNNSYFLFVTSVFVVAGSYFYEELRFREFALRTEVEESRALLESQNRQLSELDEAKTHFFANISHELRTPLTIMLGISERLKHLLEKQNDPKMIEMTQMLEQNGLRLLKLIDDLLDLVRFDTGHTDINQQPTAMGAHLDGLLRSLRHLAEQDRVTLLWDCTSEHERILLDRDKFDKILLNLVINAIKFTPSRGTIEVKLNVTGNEVVMTVEDSGVGIPPEVLPRIFERFWQVDTSSTRKFQGAGIGLALVRSLSQAMEGTVSVESKVGQGTTFKVTFPVESAGIEVETVEESVLGHGGKIADLHRRAAMAIPGKIQSKTSNNPPTPTGRVSIGSPMIGSRPSTARPLVLIADDEPDIRRFLRMQLEDVDVIEAADGAEALELAKQHQPQLVLLDQMMPEMDGIEACTRIRENHTTRGTAIIILTARADEQTKLNALQAGANDFLTKPFSTAELSLRLDNQLAMARIRREMADLNVELQAAIEQIKESEVIMVRNEKLSSLGRMSAGIIHEINNPLNYATAGLHALETFTRSLPDDDKDDFQDILKDIREGVERVSQIVIDLRQFTREDQGLTGDADLTKVMASAKRMVSHQVGQQIKFNLTAPSQAPIKGNGNQLVQVFVNLFQNSIDAIIERPADPAPEQGRIDITIDPMGEGWQIFLKDNGVGIPPENMQKIFDPFFTSKDVGKGMGLGLSITHQILQAHGAVVEVDSRPGAYTSFRMTFPGISEFNQMISRESEDSVLDQVS